MLVTLLVMIILTGLTLGPIWAEEQKTVNINKATIEELSTLKRVGPSYAQRIVEYRELHGPFEKPEDIVQVKGIGMKTFEANRDIITVK
jgi:competence protein ComEA